MDRKYQTDLLLELLNMPEGQPVIEKMNALADMIERLIPSELISRWDAMLDRQAARRATMEYLLDMFTIKDVELRKVFGLDG